METQPIHCFVCQFGNKSEADYWLQQAEVARKDARNTNNESFRRDYEKRAADCTARAIAAAS